MTPDNLPYILLLFFVVCIAIGRERHWYFERMTDRQEIANLRRENEELTKKPRPKILHAEITDDGKIVYESVFALDDPITI